MKSDEVIKEIARQTLIIEAKALSALVTVVDAKFVNAVKCVAQSKGRLVVTGLGKSAIVAKKMVATLNSTGTPSMFMHAADAVHGDLGMMSKDDILCCISKSGNTAEIKVLLPWVKKMGNLVIAMVSEKNSFLAKESDFLIHIPLDKEADPNNLAPTSSTTCQMAMGDAFAMALLTLKDFKSEDFSKFHPGGSLGKQLYLKVSDIYPKNAMPKVTEEQGLREVIVSMTSGRMGITVVIDENNIPVGVITDGDLRRMLADTKDIDEVKAIDIMTKEPIHVDKDILAIEALALLREKSITQLLVVGEKGHYAGIIHLHDLLKEGLV